MGKRSGLVLVAGAVVMVGIGMAVSASGQVVVQDASSCPDHKVCLWNQDHYEGDRAEIPASDAGTGWHNLAHLKHSAKNRMNARLTLLRYEGSDFVSCLYPGSNAFDSGPNGWDEYKVLESSNPPGDVCDTF
jgi:hypothetical protein